MDERDFARFEFQMSFGRISYIAQHPVFTSQTYVGNQTVAWWECGHFRTQHTRLDTRLYIIYSPRRDRAAKLYREEKVMLTPGQNDRHLTNPEMTMLSFWQNFCTGCIINCQNGNFRFHKSNSCKIASSVDIRTPAFRTNIMWWK